MPTNRVGSSAVERRYAKAEARVRFPAGGPGLNRRAGEQVTGERWSEILLSPAQLISCSPVLIRVRSSMAEQRPHKPKVVGSNPTVHPFASRDSGIVQVR